MYNQEDLHNKIKVIGEKLSKDGIKLNRKIVLAGLQVLKHVNEIVGD